MLPPSRRSIRVPAIIMAAKNKTPAPTIPRLWRSSRGSRNGSSRVFSRLGGSPAFHNRSTARLPASLEGRRSGRTKSGSSSPYAEARNCPLARASRLLCLTPISYSVCDAIHSRGRAMVGHTPRNWTHIPLAFSEKSQSQPFYTWLAVIAYRKEC